MKNADALNEIMQLCRVSEMQSRDSNQLMDWHEICHTHSCSPQDELKQPSPALNTTFVKLLKLTVFKCSVLLNYQHFQGSA